MYIYSPALMALSIEAQRIYDWYAYQMTLLEFPDTPEGAKAKERQSNHLDELQRVVDALDNAKDVVDLMNATYPFTILGHECSNTLASSVATAMLSFFSYLSAIAKASNPANIQPSVG